MPKKILVIEDEELLLSTLKKRFTSEGYNVSTAQDGETGLALAKREHPDLILLDIVIPQMDGLTMLKELRKDHWGRRALVIILTNLDDNKKVSEAMRQGTYGYLVKSDWKLEDLVKKVQDKLGKPSK